ncbi:hypothetical protein CBL_10418 [Carabus blaptoides fortunei]
MAVVTREKRLWKQEEQEHEDLPPTTALAAREVLYARLPGFVTRVMQFAPGVIFSFSRKAISTGQLLRRSVTKMPESVASASSVNRESIYHNGLGLNLELPDTMRSIETRPPKLARQKINSLASFVCGTIAMELALKLLTLRH